MPTKNQDSLFLQEVASKAAALLRAIGNEHRLLVLCLLIEHGEMTAGVPNEYVALRHSAWSEKLDKNCEKGLVASRSGAQTLDSSINNPAVAKMVSSLI